MERFGDGCKPVLAITLPWIKDAQPTVGQFPPQVQ